MPNELKLSDEERSKLMERSQELRAEIEERGESPEWLARLANVHLKLGEREDAILCLQKAIVLRPGTVPIIEKLKEICTEEEFENLEIPEKIEPFWNDIPGLIKYPVSGTGIYLLVGGTLFVTVFQFIISLPTLFFWATIIVAAFFAGYLSSYFVSVMRASARGESNPPDWPDITHVGSNVLHPLWVVSLPSVVSFLPALIYAIYLALYGGSLPVLILLISIGALYYPMALIASAISDAPLNSINFIAIFSSIFKVGKDYLIALAILAVFSVIGVISQIVVASVTGAIAGVIVADIALHFVYLYFLMVYGRILGLLYRQCQSKIAA
jgi:hypothetical protein